MYDYKNSYCLLYAFLSTCMQKLQSALDARGAELEVSICILYDTHTVYCSITVYVDVKNELQE